MTALAAVRARAARRTVLVCALLGVAALAIALVTLMTGEILLSPADVLAALTGHGDGLQNLVVLTLRLPRLLTAALVGAAFGLAGALFQTALRNPLASPDILGVSGGASFGAAFALLALHATGAVVPLAALVGAVLVAAAVAALSWREGFSGQRFVLVGIAAAFVASGALGYLFTRADVREAASALVWLVGSVGTPEWGEVALLAAAHAVLVPLAFALQRPLAVLQLGRDAARGLGSRPDATLLAAVAVGVALAACATAAAGPVAFVAFTSAPIARRLTASGGLQPAASALVGVVLVTASDLAGQNLPGPFDAPVGLVTGVVGAGYLLWLLARRREDTE